MLQPNKNLSTCVCAACILHAATHRFVFKKAHLSGDDFRIFDGSSGRPVAVLHHFGKNPYEKLDPLSLGNFSDAHQHMVSCYESASAKVCSPRVRHAHLLRVLLSSLTVIGARVMHCSVQHITVSGTSQCVDVVVDAHC